MIPSPPSLLEKKDIKKENEKKTNSSILNGWTYSLHKLDGSFDSFLKSLTSIVLKEETSSETRKIPLNQQILLKTILNEGETIPTYSLNLGTSYYDYLTPKQPSSQDMVNQIDEHYKMLQKYSNYSKLKKNDDAGNERMRQKCLVNILGSLLNFNQVYKKNEYEDLCKFHTVMHFENHSSNEIQYLNHIIDHMNFSFKIMGIDVLVNKHCIPVLDDDHFSFYVINTRDMTIQAHSYKFDKMIPVHTLYYINTLSTKLKHEKEKKQTTNYKPHHFHLIHVNEETIQFMKVLNMSEERKKEEEERVPINIIDELQYKIDDDVKKEKIKILNDNNISYKLIELYDVNETNIVFHPSSTFQFSQTYKMYEPRLETYISILTYNLGRSDISKKKLEIKECFSDEMVELKSDPSLSIPTTIEVNKKVCFRNIIRIAKERSTDIVCLQEIREEDLIEYVSSSFSPFHISESHVLEDRNGLMTLYRQHLYYLDQTKGGGILKGEMVITVPSVSDINTKSQTLKDTFPYLILYLREKKDEKRSICIINIQFPNLLDYEINHRTNHRGIVKDMIKTKLSKIVPYQSDIIFLSGDFGYSFTMQRDECLSFKSKDGNETSLKYGSYENGSNPSTCCTNTGDPNHKDMTYKNDTIFANVNDSKSLQLEFYPRDDLKKPNFAFSSTHLPVRAYIKSK
jgi:exonuclease III